MKRSIRRRSRGFSLVETVVALSLFAALFALLQSSFFTGSRLMRTMDSRNSRAGELIVASRVLERWIGSIILDPEADQHFTGGPSMVKAYAILDDALGKGRFAIDLSIQSSPDGYSHLIAERRRLDRPQDASERSDLLRWPGQLAFRYAVTAANGEPGWRDSFDVPGKLPSSVSLMTDAGPLVTTRIASQELARCIATTAAELVQARQCSVR